MPLPEHPQESLPADQVCLIVGNTDLSLEHNPHSTRLLTQAEALELLEAEHERGHVHHAFFKDAMFGRFYAICNCCPCCCGAMQANRHGTPMSISSGYVSQLDEGACIDCETCVEACPYSAIAAQNGSIRIDQALCMGCGVCVSTCDQEALALVRDPSKPEPLIITELMRQAASR